MLNNCVVKWSPGCEREGDLNVVFQGKDFNKLTRSDGMVVSNVFCENQQELKATAVQIQWTCGEHIIQLKHLL